MLFLIIYVAFSPAEALFLCMAVTNANTQSSLKTDRGRSAGAKNFRNHSERIKRLLNSGVT